MIVVDVIELKKYVSQLIDFSFSRSSGPGGQNVNKLNTKVTARLEVEKLYILTHAEKNRLRKNLQNRINENDEIIVQVQEERTQLKNREIALQRILLLIVHALRRKKKRIPTKPSKQAKERRLKFKKNKGILKKQRRKPPAID